MSKKSLDTSRWNVQIRRKVKIRTNSFKTKEKKGLMSTWDDLDDTSSNEDAEEANIWRWKQKKNTPSLRAIQNLSLSLRGNPSLF